MALDVAVVQVVLHCFLRDHHIRLSASLVVSHVFVAELGKVNSWPFKLHLLKLILIASVQWPTVSIGALSE